MKKLLIAGGIILVKTRQFPESNYKAVWYNGKTIRIALDPKKPITELEYPEFYDVKLTGKCLGACDFCYQDSKKTDNHYENIIEKINQYFGPMSENERPFQFAYGGGEPTSHPDFTEILRVTKSLGIEPNYTTNGMFIDSNNYSEIMLATKKYCGGVAVSCHPHLKDYWMATAERFYASGVKLNLHIIISGKESIDYFKDIYNEWHDKVDYFVLLPYGNQGRAEDKDIDFEYLVKVMPEKHNQIAFGANFYPYLLGGGHNIKVSLYEPEIMSKYLDMKDMSLYASSFSDVKIK